MKKTKLLRALPAALAILLLAGCSNSPTLKDKDKTFVSMSEVKSETYQEVFDKLYKSQGVQAATNELLYRVAKEVLTASSNWTAEEIEAEIHERIVERFDTYYSSSYQTNGLFDEQKVITSLVGSGYDIKRKEADPYVETVDDLVGYDHVYDRLTYDYSDFEEKLAKDFYVELLKEEYILSQRAAASSTYFKNKDVRRVQYFTWTPANSNERIKWADLFQTQVDEAIENEVSFEELVKGEGGLEEQWKLKQLKDLADDFALINARAAGVLGEAKAVNEDEDYPLPATYSEVIVAYEKSEEVVNDETKGFRNIYVENDYNETQKAEVKTKIATYSANGTQSIYYGYYQKQLSILKTSMFTEKVTTSDSASTISTDINNAIEDLDPLYKETNYLDVTESGTVILKSGSANYIVYATAISDDAAEKATADEKDAARELAKTSTNVKNAIYYYLTELTNAKKFEVNNQDVYDYLNATYGYGENS